VHCAASGIPIIGDPIYFKRRARKELLENKYIADLIRPISRQMLHGWRLTFTHPVKKQPVVFEAPIPEDMQKLIDGLPKND
jgi:23S rRNA pseudouridine1911/1915/1917 synthase